MTNLSSRSPEWVLLARQKAEELAGPEEKPGDVILRALDREEQLSDGEAEELNEKQREVRQRLNIE